MEGGGLARAAGTQGKVKKEPGVMVTETPRTAATDPKVLVSS